MNNNNNNIGFNLNNLSAQIEKLSASMPPESSSKYSQSVTIVKNIPVDGPSSTNHYRQGAGAAAGSNVMNQNFISSNSFNPNNNGYFNSNFWDSDSSDSENESCSKANHDPRMKAIASSAHANDSEKMYKTGINTSNSLGSSIFANNFNGSLNIKKQIYSNINGKEAYQASSTKISGEALKNSGPMMITADGVIFLGAKP